MNNYTPYDITTTYVIIENLLYINRQVAKIYCILEGTFHCPLGLNDIEMDLIVYEGKRVLKEIVKTMNNKDAVLCQLLNKDYIEKYDTTNTIQFYKTPIDQIPDWMAEAYPAHIERRWLRSLIKLTFC